MFGGMPFLGDIQTQVFYPINWIFAFLSTNNQQWVYWLIELKCLLHILLGAIGFYLFMREIKISRIAATLSGLTFGLSGFMVVHIIHLTLISTFAWFPLILLFFYRALFNHRFVDALISGVIFGIANLAGHPQMTLHMVYSLGLLFLLYIISGWYSERRLIVTTHIPIFLATILTGFTLAACAYLPAYRYSLYTVRELMTYTESAELSLPPSFVITTLIPKFFGSVTGSGTDSVEFWGTHSTYAYWETVSYLGIAPFVLSLLGIIFNRNKLRWHFIILALFALLLALGRNTPLYRLAFEFLPGFNRFRIPARFVGIFIFSLSSLAGLGMDLLLNTKSHPKKLMIPGFCLLGYGTIIIFLLISRVLNRTFSGLNETLFFNNAIKQSLIFIGLSTATLILIWLTIRYRKLRTLFAGLLLALTFFDLYHFGHQFNLGIIAPEQFYPRRPFIDHLVQESKDTPFRINARTGQYMILQRNEGLLWQLELLEGYTPLKLTDFATFDIPQERKNNLLNVRYQIAVDSVNRTARLEYNSEALPRVWLADSCVIIPDHKRILNLLANPDFDYTRIVVLEKKPMPLPRPGDDPPGSVLILQRSPENMTIQAELNRPAVLMVSEVFYPEWRASVNGQPVEILRADYCLRAIILPAGNHTVKFYFDRRLINAGITISLVTLGAVFLILSIAGRFRNKVPK